MKKFKTLILAAYSVALLAACGESGDATFKSIEINELPKTTFYCGEAFSNTGISLKVNLNDGTSFVTEDIATSKPSTATPGTQTVKVYYTNDKYDVDTFISYEINIIDWTKEEKHIFSQTSISTLSGVYYPKMEGMQVITETDDVTGDVVDYWIEKKNATFKDIDEYSELLKNYLVTKKMQDSSGVYDMTFKFYEQSMVPSDFVENFDLNDALCFKYCASYEYMDPTYFETYELYGNEIEDTVVFGLNDDGDMIVRFIANSVMLEGLLSCEVNERLDMTGLYNGTIIEYLNQALLGTIDEEGSRYLGLVERLAPFAKEYFVLPNYEPDVVAVKNLSSMYPWEHGGFDLSFEIEVDSDDVDGYEELVAALDAKTDFVKTTGTTKVRNLDATTTVYTIEGKDYIGDLEITVSEFKEKAASYYVVEGSTRTKVECGCYVVGYTFLRPEIFSPTQPELFRIYDTFYGTTNGVYEENVDYDVYEDGEVGGLVKYTRDEVHSREEASQLFSNSVLTGYTVKIPGEDKDVNGIEVYATTYTNGTFDVDVFAYYSGGKYAVEFSVKIAQN